MNEAVAIEATAARTALARRNLVGADVLVRKLYVDLKQDGNEVVPLKLPGVPARDDGLDRGETLLAAERFAAVLVQRGLAALGRRLR